MDQNNQAGYAQFEYNNISFAMVSTLWGGCPPPGHPLPACCVPATFRIASSHAIDFGRNKTDRWEINEGLAGVIKIEQLIALLDPHETSGTVTVTGQDGRTYEIPEGTIIIPATICMDYKCDDVFCFRETVGVYAERIQGRDVRMAEVARCPTHWGHLPGMMPDQL